MDVKLFNNAKERDMYDNMADLYSILVTIEHLEKAYVRDSCSPREYSVACSKLIAQYRTVQKLVNIDIDAFIKEYRIDCKAAVERLRVGIPATIEFDDHHHKDDHLSVTQVVAEATQHFITAMDSLKLNMTAVDQVLPLLVDIVESLNKVPFIASNPDFEGKLKLKNWLYILNAMKASDQLDEEQSRQLLFDLEMSYSAFYKALKSKN
eukprot:TRINITY_DN6178_c0_g1_i1.p1 TRINITY_DN6178_c0_g1~~TRINITY_DN6178_c0_g1_i1.p1  ORF type:complete len:221 (+),score=36.06 TRINITY_DN6178_c0_g1_i1:40-663(+)